MYFKTSKDSETGKKFAEIYKRAKEATEAANNLVNELQKDYPAISNKYRPGGGLLAWGGIYSLIFSEKPDSKVWKEVLHMEYLPKQNSKEGKRIAKLISDLPTVQYPELNACIGYKGFRNKIGFTAGKDHFGFEVSKDWGLKIPSDCEEILSSEYENL